MAATKREPYHFSTGLARASPFAAALLTKIDRLARSTSDLYRIISTLVDKGVSFKVIDDPSIDTTSRTVKLVMGVLMIASGR